MKHAKREAIMTSGKDREHGYGSFHYYGMAFDLQTKDLSMATAQDIVAELAERLPNFDVVFETSHIHIEVGIKLGVKLGAYSV